MHLQTPTQARTSKTTGLTQGAAITCGGEGTGQRKRRVLLVDDNEAVRLLLSRVLGLQGWEITTAGCGAEALEAWPADGRPYDAVVMDLNMPGLNGYETYCRLRRLHPETRCLFITGHANADLRAAIHREGLVCLDKPVPMEDLIAHVRELLK